MLFAVVCSILNPLVRLGPSENHVGPLDLVVTWPWDFPPMGWQLQVGSRSQIGNSLNQLSSLEQATATICSHGLPNCLDT